MVGRRFVAAALAAGAAAGGGGEARAAPSPARLLARYEPVVVLHPEERFRPSTVDAFLRAAQLERQTAANAWTPAQRAPRTLPTANPPGCVQPCWRLRRPECSASVGVASLACFGTLEAAAASPAAVYGAVHVRRTRIALQYWYWYTYDFWSGEQPPTDYVWQAHDGDWEVVTVLLTRRGEPLLAGYSQHLCGKRRPWARVPTTQRTHPTVYVALGTHANYFSGGTQAVDLRRQCYPPVGAAVLRGVLPAVLEYTGEGERLGPRAPRVGAMRIARVTASSPQWMRFPGRWGEANFFHAPGLGTKPAAPGPEGPAFHALWRHPVATVLRWPRG